MSRPILATYRLQLHSEFGFGHAAAVTDYLRALGVTHLYSSPCLQAAPGSTHGYDVVDPHRVSEVLGGAAGHAQLCAALDTHDLGLVLDVVPNHMSIASRDNAWWWDVLENGPASRFAGYFDVDWSPPEAKLHNLVLVPILADQYGRALESGAIRLARESDAAFVIRYADHVLPVAPTSLAPLLGAAAARSANEDLAAIADAFEDLPGATDARRARRHRDAQWLRGQLRRLSEQEPSVRGAIEAEVAAVNADVERLHALLEQQNYRLAFWRTAARELGYRRFFDITTLIGLRVEDAEVFADTHALIVRWLRDGVLDGVRVDHPDGLRDPEAYLRRLRGAGPDAWILVEKILASEERLRDTWPVDGTTGYDFIHRVGALFIDPEGEAPLTAFYGEFTRAETDYRTVAREKKLLVMRETLAADVNRLTALLVEVCERHRRYRDHTRHELHEAVRELLAGVPVYRTYVRAGDRPNDDDTAAVHAAVEAVKAHRPELDGSLVDFLGDLLLLRIPGAVEQEFALRFQQLSGSVTAKGIEDTAFYCFNRFIALNEVGSDPGEFGAPVDAFHRGCQAAQARWPSSMSASSTHDTKRSEDVRARLSLLSEIPARWASAVRRWAALNDRQRRDGMPDRNDEYHFYQTVVGAWPIETERIEAYMQKAIREAKVHTSWTRRDGAYEAAVQQFVAGALGDSAFRTELAAFVAPLIEPGRVTGLAQTLVKLTAPGVPDLYQGSELWDLSVVDPDNRRPVDYALRRELLGALDGCAPEEIWARCDEGLPKLWTIRQALALRRERPEWFGALASYEPVTACGARAAHVVAFARARECITVVPRLLIGLGAGWAETSLEIPSGRWRNWLTADTIAGGTVRLATLLRRFPIALLTRE
jgi:(1->4)-alpha-D-glucan 1-alpha-D-glucosylmutase